MEKTMHTKLAIIGSGPAGLTAAIYASRANLKPLLIAGSKPGGQLMNTSYVENWPGYKSILGPDLMINMQQHAAHFGSKSLEEDVVSTDFSKAPFRLTTNKGTQITADSVIIASGACPKQLGCPGEQEYWGKGVTTCAVCDGAFYKDKKVIIIGGGDTAMEDASFMLNFTQDITVIHIGPKLTASVAMQKRVINNSIIKIIYESTVTRFRGNGQHLTHATITHQKTKESYEIPVDGAFIAIGINPNVGPFKGQVQFNNYGFIQVENNTHTSVQGVFVAGDVADYEYRQAITAAGAGCMAALDAERYLKSMASPELNLKKN
jgi:thioredoxin reductase (NADPH)